MEEESVDTLQRDLLQVLVGAVDGVAGLEPAHRPPAPLGLGPPDLERCQVVLREAGVGTTEGAHRAGDRPGPPFAERVDARVGVLVGPIDRCRLPLGRRPEDRLDLDNGDRPPAVPGRELVLALYAAPLGLSHAQDDRDREGVAAAQPPALEPAPVIRLGHEPGQGGEGAGADHQGVGGLARPDLENGQPPGELFAALEVAPSDAAPDVATPLQRIEDAAQGLVDGLPLAVNGYLRGRGGFVRVVDPGEVLDLSPQRLRVEALDVAPGQLLDRAANVGLEEAGRLATDLVPYLLVGEIAAVMATPPERATSRAA